MQNIKYSEILRRNKELKDSLKGEPFQITVLSNIITSTLNEILEYTLRCENINADVVSGDYDNIPQGSLKFKNSKLAIIFWETSNLVDGLQFKADIMENALVEDLILKVKSEIDIVFRHLQSTSTIIFNKFSTLIFNHYNIKPNSFDKICNSLNNYLEKVMPKNVVLIDIDKIIAKVSIEQSVDFRYYYSSKALYTVKFYKAYSEFIKPVILSVQGRKKKALIFDCDNTLWRGIIGEDLFNGIEMTNKSKNGAVFSEIQSLAVSLSNRGIIIGLCSKNNPQDVNEVLENHPDLTLKEDYITIRKVNWMDKVTNFLEIAKELNINLDSFVFVDDSDFEVNLIREKLPQVTVIQVPKKLHKYPDEIRKNMGLFFDIFESKEDRKRIFMYKQEKQREMEKQRIGNLDDYLMSLGLKMRIDVDNPSHISRTAQMTQKTNQFNFTTKRYTESDIEDFIQNDNFKVYIFDVYDKFGDYGITGLCIVQFENNKDTSIIDTFLMSCRVIGRNLELAFFDFIIKDLQKYHVSKVHASYVKTNKNSQVENFYDKLGFTLVEQLENKKVYSLEMPSGYKLHNINYIEVLDGRKN